MKKFFITLFLLAAASTGTLVCMETTTMTSATADNPEAESMLTPEERVTQFLVQLQQIQENEQALPNMHNELEALVKNGERSFSGNQEAAETYNKAINFAKETLKAIDTLTQHLTVIDQFISNNKIGELIKQINSKNEPEIFQQVDKQIDYEKWEKILKHYGNLTVKVQFNYKNTLNLAELCHQSAPRTATPRSPEKTTQTTPSASPKNNSPETTIWQQNIPYLADKPAIGFFALVRNFFCPQIPTLEIKNAEEATTIDANQNREKLVADAAKILGLNTLLNENQLKKALDEKKQSPTEALKFALCARATSLTAAINKFEPATMLANISNARGWRCGLAAATAIGFGANRFFTNLRLVPLAFGTIASFYLLKPVCTSLMQRLLERSAHEQITQNTLIYNDYLGRLRGVGLGLEGNGNTAHAEQQKINRLPIPSQTERFKRIVL